MTVDDLKEKADCRRKQLTLMHVIASLNMQYTLAMV